MDKLRVGLIVNQQYQPASGGGYSYYNLLLHALNNFDFSENIEISNVIVYTDTLPRIHLKKPCIYVKSELHSRIRRSIHTLIRHFGLGRIRNNRVGNFMLSVSRGASERKTEQLLKQNRIDVLYYLNPVDKVFNYPFIMTHWDVGHRSTYPFPMLAMNGVYETRENYYTYVLNKAMMILCESESGRRELQQYYKFFSNKIRVVPLFGGSILTRQVSDAQQQRALEKYGLESGKFFVYPAQFWPHKNHYNLLRAFASLRAGGHNDIRLMLCGSDKGNMRYICSIISEMGLKNAVIVPGFVTDEELYAFYRHAIAMVMPTFLGPSNLPLIEAPQLGCPVLCSDLGGHREILGEDAEYFSPTDPDGIRAALTAVLDESYRRDLAKRAGDRIRGSVFNIEHSVKALHAVLQELYGIRKTWGY
jgi:glycosyltransferase involved in cell wall biosynthesis